ncbi:hypothetical protein ACFO25_19060 [Paenactinomyces guangxiensis]|uniref:Uncharacterized protein n=1 Tax=Paenactinomyces guangxiensis TaxID=1490290 RepID=A0A7W1WSV0_9BACL|nr:hypothetical protein [Paenactinomyces guangxiensis]MBA4495412.1 hypothetical protein [Paenactinomyces guangxiensis]MBH8592467.1 hypothetical protein [Paenactinomyces guangxiensis]
MRVSIFAIKIQVVGNAGSVNIGTTLNLVSGRREAEPAPDPGVPGPPGIPVVPGVSGAREVSGISSPTSGLSSNNQE